MKRNTPLLNFAKFAMKNEGKKQRKTTANKFANGL